jgi:hypothetical protein
MPVGSPNVPGVHLLLDNLEECRESLGLGSPTAGCQLRFVEWRKDLFSTHGPLGLRNVLRSMVYHVTNPT